MALHKLFVVQALWDIDSTRPAANWPADGRLYFTDYWTRYREGLDPVLRGVTLDIKPMEKVGICGRTGVLYLYFFIYEYLINILMLSRLCANLLLG